MQFVSTVTLSQACLKILLVEDNTDDADLIEEFLSDSRSQKQLSLTRVERLSVAVAALVREKFDIILLDLSLPDSYGFDTVAKVQEYACNIPIVVLTANSDEQVAFQSLQAGAQDYLIKGHIDSISLTRSLKYAIKRYHEKEALRQSEEKYRSVVNNLKAALFQTDAAGKWTFLNPTWTNLTGFPVNQSLETSFFYYIYPEDRPRYLEELNALITGQKSHSSIQLRVVAASGKFPWFELQQNLTIDSNSAAPSITGMLTSIPAPNLASSKLNQSPNPWQNSGNCSVKNHIQILSSEEQPDGETNLQLNQCPETKQQERLVTDLLKSEATNRALLNAIPDMMFRSLADGTIRDFKPAKNLKTLVPPSAFIGKKLAEILPPDLASRIIQANEQAINTGEVQVLEYQLSINDELRDYEARITACGSDETISMVRDISDRKQAELLNQQQAAAMAAASDGIAILNAAGEHLYLNTAHAKIFGYSSVEALLGKSWKILYPKAELPRFQQEIMPSVIQKGHCSAEAIGRRRDGTAFPHELSVTSMEGGGFICIVRDMTERKLAEVALRESQHFIQQIAESSPNLLYLYDLLEQRNIFINRNIAEMLGYSPEETQAMGSAVLPTLMHPEDFARFPDYLHQVKNGCEGDCFENEYRMKHKNGSWYWFSSREIIFARTPDGKPKQLLGTATDITELKQTAEALTQKAQQLALRSDIGFALAQGGDLSSMLKLCTQVLVQHLNAAFARIWTLNREANVLELQASAGIYTHLNGPHARIPVGHFKIGLIASEKKPYLTNDVQNDPRVSDREWAKREGMVAFAGYPLILEEQVVGVMALFSRRPWSADTLEGLTFIASEIAVGIERKRAALALQLSGQRLQMAVEASSLGIWDWNLGTGQVYFSPEWKTMLGYEADELENDFTVWERLLHPEDLPKAQAILTSHLQGASPTYEVEFRMQAKSGEWQWIQSYGKVCEWDESGNPRRMTGTHRDINDRKQAEAELMKFRLVVKSTSDAVGMADIHGNHYYQNQAFTDLFEYPTAEAFKEAGGLVVAFADPAVGQEVVTAIMGDQSWVGEVEHRSRTGRLIPALLRANAIKDDSGRLVGLVAMSTDISARKRAEEARRQLTRQLQEAQRVAQIGNWEFDLLTGNVSWSDELFRIYHREFGNIPTFEEILQQIHPEDQGRWLEGVQGAMAEGRSYDIDHRVSLPNGEIGYINAKGQGILDESGSVVGLFGTAMDISGRKQVEIALQQQFLREQLLGAIVLRMRQSLQIEDILNTTVTQLQQALQTDRVIVYQIFANGTGCAIAEAAAAGCQRILNIIFPEEIFPQSIYEQYLQGRVCAVSDRDLGGIVPCLIEFMDEIQVRAKLVVPIIQTGKLWGLLIAHQCFQPRIWQEWEIGLFQQLANQLAIGIQQSILFEQAQTEISERKAAEIALRESDARERAKAIELEQTLNKLKNTQTQLVQQEKMAGLGQLVAGVAHEINNPVSFIFGNIEPASDYASDLLKLIDLYQKYYPTPVAEIASEIKDIDLDFLKQDFHKLLSSMKEGASRIKDIVLSLRTFSRLDEAEMKEADLHSGIDSTLMILEHRLKEHPHRKAIQVIKEYGDLPLVECYPGQINQVFMNLLSNAIDALEQKLKEGADFTPTIQIRTEIREPAEEGNPNSVLIRIADNGSGIPPEVQERIFNPFFTTKPVGSGTGLGLSISYQIIVEKHRGELLCYSQLNRGTEFFIKITQGRK